MHNYFDAFLLYFKYPINYKVHDVQIFKGPSGLDFCSLKKLCLTLARNLNVKFIEIYVN